MDEPTGTGPDRDGDDEVTAAVLEFVRRWPSPYPSPTRIAHAIGRPSTAVIAALDRIKASGAYPVAEEESPPPPPVTPLERWDRAN